MFHVDCLSMDSVIFLLEINNDSMWKIYIRAVVNGKNECSKCSWTGLCSFVVCGEEVKKKGSCFNWSLQWIGWFIANCLATSDRDSEIDQLQIYCCCHCEIFHRHLHQRTWEIFTGPHYTVTRWPGRRKSELSKPLTRFTGAKYDPYTGPAFRIDLWRDVAGRQSWDRRIVHRCGNPTVKQATLSAVVQACDSSYTPLIEDGDLNHFSAGHSQQ